MTTANIVIVSGALANKPHNGGEAWVRLSWIQALTALGFDVYFVEQIDRAACIDGAGAPAAFADSANLSYFQSEIAQAGLTGRAALVYTGDSAAEMVSVAGTDAAMLREIVEDAALLVNISGHLTLPGLLAAIRCKAYVDIDPGFTQFWHAAGLAGAHLAGHDHFFTIGANIGSRACPIPTGGLRWHAILQPVLLDAWPICPPPAQARSTTFTTVANWRGPYGPLVVGDTTYGLKVHEFRKMITLPRCVPYRFEIALNIYPADTQDRASLLAHGWQLVDPAAHTGDSAAFRRYVQGSAAEFSVAQGVYVDTCSGWFSDRSVRYLASGRPVLVQETGFSRHLPVGEGLLAFRTPEEAARGAQMIMTDVTAHSRAARALAERYFAAPQALAPLLEVTGVAP
jgi:hypothetical protein